MGDMLSQAEIDALLNGTSLSNTGGDSPDAEALTSQETDALGEIGNISMGTSATTLFTLLGHKVLITTPKVTITSWEQMAAEYGKPFVAVKVEYTQGLIGSNLLILNEGDVKIITDLMMGGDGSNTAGELTDLHLSAISEAMNQMIGSSATSMSSMFDKRIDISPPRAFIIHFDSTDTAIDFESNEKLVKIAFKMVIEGLIDSEIMQLLPISFAKELVNNLLNTDLGNSPASVNTQQAAPKASAPQKPQQPQPQTPQQPQMGYMPPQPQPQQQAPQQFGGYAKEPPQVQGYQQQNYAPMNMDYNQGYYEAPKAREPINVQPAQFQSFDEDRIMVEKKNISLIMDVPLQVTVELGRTQKLIKDILEFGTGSIIELEKLAGEPVDILVNGKPIAKGEVVVIDESFGVRITDIIHPSKRL